MISLISDALDVPISIIEDCLIHFDDKVSWNNHCHWKQEIWDWPHLIKAYWSKASEDPKIMLRYQREVLGKKGK